MTERLDVAVVGAGPYGLSVSAHLRGVRKVRTFGRPMHTWRTRMPPDMRLRSDWHETSFSAPGGTATFDGWAAETGEPREEPIPLQKFLRYSEWFRERYRGRRRRVGRRSRRACQRNVPADDRRERGGRRVDAGHCRRRRAVRGRPRPVRRGDGRRRQVRDRSPGLQRLRVAPRRRRRRRPGRPRERAPRGPRRSRRADGRALEPALVRGPRAAHRAAARSATALSPRIPRRRVRAPAPEPPRHAPGSVLPSATIDPP